MPLDFDPNVVAVEFLQANLEGAVAVAKAKVKGARNFLRSRFEATYHTYLKRLIDRHSRSKSFFVRSEPIPLYDFFVPLDLHTQKTLLTKPSAAELAGVSPAVILSGTGGCGKSMMMRHLLLSVLQGKEKTPLFVELRSLNGTETSLLDALLLALTANGLDVDLEYLLLALKAGHFLILLDGYDELDRASRRKLAKSIQDLAERYPRNWLVLSSRPDTELQGWTGFTTWQVAPLDLDRAVELVSRLTFDPAIKGRFVNALQKGLFAQHGSFLSNPLLLSIMLLTYHDTASIPNKLSIFYNLAYESLFQKHDALKAGYEREKLTSLDIQEFERVFAAFCIQSFEKREFTFPATRALELLDNAKRLTNVAFKSADYLKDAIQAICLLVEEGMDIAFVHRSFQEYFTARFIAAAPPNQRGQLTRRYARTVGSDAVIPLLYELDIFTVEYHYVLPSIQRLRQLLGIKRTLTDAQYLKCLQHLFRDFELTKDGQGHIVSTIGDSLLVNALIFTLHRYLTRPPLPPERREELSRALAQAFVEEFGEEGAQLTADISPKSKFLALLSTSDGLWGKQTIRELLALESIIQRRHKDARESLNNLLS